MRVGTALSISDVPLPHSANCILLTADCLSRFVLCPLSRFALSAMRPALCCLLVCVNRRKSAVNCLFSLRSPLVSCSAFAAYCLSPRLALCALLLFSALVTQY